MVKNNESLLKERIATIFKRGKTSNCFSFKRSNQAKQTVDSHTHNRSENIVKQLVKNEDCEAVEIG